MKWLTQPFKVTDKQEVQNGLYTNCYLYYTEKYQKDGEEKEGTQRIQVPKKIYDMTPKGSKVQLVRVEFYHRDKKKYLDFISDVNIAK